jgi:hypothetical protein
MKEKENSSSDIVVSGTILFHIIEMILKFVIIDKAYL